MPTNPSRAAASIAAVAFAVSGCNMLLGVEQLKAGRDAGVTQTRELAALAADSGEANPETQSEEAQVPADASAPDIDSDSAPAAEAIP